MNTLRRFSTPIALVIAIAIAALSNLLPRFDLFLVGQLALLIIVTAALVMLMAGAGLLAMSSAAFLGIGAYGSIILVEQLHIPFLLSIPAVALIGGLIGWMLGLVSLRLSGFYLAIITLGFLLILLVFLKHGGELTGSGYGLVAPLVEVPLIGSVTAQGFAVLAVFLAVLVVYAVSAMMRSRYGRAWLALRDHAPAALMQGIDVRAAKLRVFALSSAIIAGAGAVYAYLLGSANPASFVVNVSIFHIALVVVGGLTGGMVGAVLAPVVLYFIPEIFNALGEYRDILYASLLLAVLVFFPGGIDGIVKQGLRKIQRAIPKKATK